MYSPDQWEIIAEVNSVACITLVSLIFGRKLASVDGPIHYTRGLLLVLYGLTWAFSLIACMLTSTNNGNFISCVMTQFNVALIATAIKIVLFLYFTEKIYILSVPKSSRMKNHMYLLSLGLITLLLGTTIVQIFYRINIVQQDYPFHCIVGLELPASILSLGYDGLLATLYSVIFIKFHYFPTEVQESAHKILALSIIAKRNAIAAVLSVFALNANYIVILCLNGHQRGLIASSSTTIAVSFICLLIHWVTAHPAESQSNQRALQQLSVEKTNGLRIEQHVTVSTESNRVQQ